MSVWVLVWEPATGGYTIADGSGTEMANVDNAREGAESHARALVRIGGLAREVIAVGAQLDDVRAELVLQLDAAQTELEGAHAELQRAQAELGEVETELEGVRTELDATRGELELAEADVMSLRAELDKPPSEPEP